MDGEMVTVDWERLSESGESSKPLRSITSCRMA